MIHVLLLSHGRLAEALLDTAHRIAGDELPRLHCLALDWNAPQERLRRRLAAAIEEMDEGDGVLVLTDLYGDTPSNLALSMRRPGQVEVVTGVNLPMVLRLSCLGTRSMELEELVGWIRDKGRQGIRSSCDENGAGGHR